MSDSILMGFLGLVTGLISAVVAGYIAIQNQKIKNRQEESKISIDDMKAKADDRDRIIDRMERQIAGYQEHAAQQQSAIDSLYKDNADCREDYSMIYGWCYHAHALLSRQRDILLELGKDPGPELTLPERSERSNTRRTEFRARTVSQNTGLLREISGDSDHAQPPKATSKSGQHNTISKSEEDEERTKDSKQ